jgi:hypothetical protein
MGVDPLLLSKKILEIYSHRGRRATYYLSQDNPKKAEFFLKKQRVAWHNFEAAFALLSSDEQAYLRQEPALLAVAEMQLQLFQTIKEKQTVVLDRLQKIKKERQQLKKINQNRPSYSHRIEQSI